MVEEWSRTTTVVEVLDAVRLLLQEPDLRGEWSGYSLVPIVPTWN